MSHKHLSRLESVFSEQPVFFVTTCTHRRKPNLASDALHDICLEVWRNSEELYGWLVGRYILMPDHVHFFCTPRTSETRLEVFVGKWKEWTAKLTAGRNDSEMPFWQAEFFDHVLRSSESYEEKWLYTRDNPVRHGVVKRWQDWPYQGELNEFRVDDI